MNREFYEIFGKKFAIVANNGSKTFTIKINNREITAKSNSIQDKLIEEFILVNILNAIDKNIDNLDFIVKRTKGLKNFYSWISLRDNKIRKEKEIEDYNEIESLVEEEIIYNDSIGYIVVEFIELDNGEGYIRFFSFLKDNGLDKKELLELKKQDLDNFNFSRSISKSKIVKYLLIHFFFIFVILGLVIIPGYFNFTHKKVLNTPILKQIKEKTLNVKKIKIEVSNIKGKIEYLKNKENKTILKINEVSVNDELEKMIKDIKDK